MSNSLLRTGDRNADKILKYLLARVRATPGVHGDSIRNGTSSFGLSPHGVGQELDIAGPDVVRAIVHLADNRHIEFDTTCTVWHIWMRCQIVEQAA